MIANEIPPEITGNAYRHARWFTSACKCGSRQHRHAGYVGRGRVRIWRCLKCSETHKVAAEFLEVIDRDGVGHLRPI